MPKINIKVDIINEEEEHSLNTKGILNEEVLTYKEENKTKATFNYQKNELVRENKEMKMMYPFLLTEKGKGIIEMKQMNRRLILELKTEKIERKNHDIKIQYVIEGKKYLYQIEEIK